MKHRPLRIVRWLLAAALLSVGACESQSEADFDRSTVTAGLGVGLTPAQMSTPGQVATNIPCFERADERTTLSRDQALVLCRGARSTAPARCFEEVDDETTLSDGQAVRLCRCAKSLRPLRCFQTTDEETLFAEEDIVEMCRPIRADRLTRYCVPIRER